MHEFSINCYLGPKQSCAIFFLLVKSEQVLWHVISRGCSSFRNIHLLWRRSSTGYSEYLLWCGSSMDCSEYPSLPWSTSSSSDLGVPSVVRHSFCSLLVSLFNILYPFLNTFSQRCHQLGWWAQLCPVVGLLWSWLQLVVASTGQPLTSSHRGHPCSLPLPCYQNHATYTQYKMTL